MRGLDSVLPIFSSSALYGAYRKVGASTPGTGYAPWVQRTADESSTQIVQRYVANAPADGITRTDAGLRGFLHVVAEF
jgi:hypothetical protein